MPPNIGYLGQSVSASWQTGLRSLDQHQRPVYGSGGWPLRGDDQWPGQPRCSPKFALVWKSPATRRRKS